MSLGKFIDRAICRNIHPCSSDFPHKVLTSIRNFLIVAIMETLRLALVICVWHDEFKRELLCGNETRQDWLHSIPNIHFLISHRAMSIRIKVGLLSSPSSWHTLAIKRSFLEQSTVRCQRDRGE